MKTRKIVKNVLVTFMLCGIIFMISQGKAFAYGGEGMYKDVNFVTHAEG